MRAAATEAAVMVVVATEAVGRVVVGTAAEEMAVGVSGGWWW